MKPKEINKRETRGKGFIINYKKDQEQRKSELEEEENSMRTSAARGQWRYQQGYGKRRTQPENSQTCERAPETDPHQQRRAQRKEDRREICHWKREHLQKTPQAPPEEKMQKDSRKNKEYQRVNAAEIRQKIHHRPADKQRETEKPIQSDAEWMSVAGEVLPSAGRESPDFRGGMVHKLLLTTEDV